MSVAADWMHAKNIGVDAYFQGSVVFLLVYSIYASTPAENAAALESDLQNACRVRGVGGLQRLTLSPLIPFGRISALNLCLRPF